MQASPFLVSRNRYLDYRTVVAPQFIRDAGISNLLARAADTELVESEDAFFYRQVQGSKAGDFSIVFRVLKAKIKDNELSEEVAKDQFGREIYLLEGFVFQVPNRPAVSTADFDKLHQLLIPKYERFWALTEPEPALPSSSIELKTAVNLVTPQQLPIFKIIPRPSENEEKKGDRQWIITGTILVILILLCILVGRMFLGYPVLPAPQSAASPKTEQPTETKQPALKINSSPR